MFKTTNKTSTITNMTTGKRYSLVNKNSGKVRRGASTRAEARDIKRPTERIWDVVKSAYVR